jgi:hypothetical protein
MDSAQVVPSNKRLPIWSDCATAHATVSGESRYLFPALQVPEPQRSVTRTRGGTATVRRHRHGHDPVRMAFGALRWFGRSPSPRAAALRHPSPRRRADRPALPPQPRPRPYGPGTGGWFGHSPSPRAAAFRHPSPRRHDRHRASPPRPRPRPYGLGAGGWFGRSPSPRAAASGHASPKRHGDRPASRSASRGR